MTRGDEPRWRVDRSCPEADDGPVTVWANWNTRETMPDPLTPLVWTVWRDVLLRLVVRTTIELPRRSPLYRLFAVLDRVQGRIYWNMNALLAIPGVGSLFRKGLPLIDHEAGEVLGRLMDAGAIRPRRIPESRVAFLLAFAAAQARALLVVFESLSPRRSLRRLAAFSERERAHARPVATLSDAELLAELRRLDGPAGASIVGVMHLMGIAIGVYRWASHAFRGTDAERLLVAGLTGSPTTQVSIAIDELVEEARPIADRFAGGDARAVLDRLAGDEAGRTWRARLGSFLDRFGQRCPREFDLASPRWAEDPTMIVDAVRAGLAATPADGVRARLARLSAERRKAIDAAIDAAPWWRRPLLRWLARKVEEHMPLREAPKHHLMVTFLGMRWAILEIGARLAARGVIGERDDVFFLELAEVDAILGGAPARGVPSGPGTPPDLAERVAKRREEHARFLAEPAPDFLRSDGLPIGEEVPAAAASSVLCGTPVSADRAAEPVTLRGTPVSAGRATGRARLLRSPDPSRLGEGDVLVVEFADPGWTPLFPRAGALVMEVGGMMCHAAVVAREMGVPAVFGVRGAMRALSDGDTVTVDGDRGTVARA